MKVNKEFFKSILISLLTGLLIGLVVGVYQFILSYVSHFGSDVFASREWWIILLNVIGIITLSILNFIIIKNARSVDSSGIISINLSLRMNEEIKCTKEIPLMIANSAISTYAQFPLGSEGPSITLAGKCAALVNKIFKRKDDENVKIAFGAGFGAAFISPLSGFFYSFEEELHKVDLRTFFRTLVMMLGMGSVIIFLNHHHSLAFETFEYIKLENTLVLLLIYFLTVIIAPIYLWLIRRLKIFYIKHDDNFFIKYRAFFFFFAMLILGYTLNDYLGCGDKIIQGILTIKSVYLLILLLVFRGLLTSIIGNGKVTGGLIVPSLALGAIISGIGMNLFSDLYQFNEGEKSFIILLSMCMFFAFISEAPLTAITLFLSNIFYMSKNIDLTNPVIYLGVTLISMVFITTKVFKTLPLYDMLLETEEEFKFKKKLA